MVATFFRSPHSLSSCTDGNKVVRSSLDHIARVRLGKGLALSHSNRHVAHAVASKPTLSSKLEELLNKEDDRITVSKEEEEEEDEFDDFDAPDDPSALSTQQVASLLNTICEDTEIAEIRVQMGGFGLKLRRKIAQDPVLASQAVGSNGAVPGPFIEQAFQSTASMDESQIIPQAASNGHLSSSDEEDHDENLIFLGAPKVGVLRRHRYVKGKRVGKNALVEEGARVKKGQLLAFIEQLGTHVPIEAPQAGEIVSFEIEDGTAVEYKEVIVEMAPFFGGHIIGDKKYA